MSDRLKMQGQWLICIDHRIAVRGAIVYARSGKFLLSRFILAMMGLGFKVLLISG